MSNKLRRLVSFLLAPNAFIVVLTMILTLVLCLLSLYFVLNSNLMMELFSIIIYSLAFIFLSYAVYIFVIGSGKIKTHLVNFIKKLPYGQKLLTQYGFRTLVFSSFSTILNLLIVLLHVGLAFHTKQYSWYFSLAGYYVLLIILKGGIALFHKSKRKFYDPSSIKQAEILKYRFSGIILSIIPLFLLIPILHVAFLDRTFSHPGWTIFAFAAYAFFKIIAALIHMFKIKSQTDFTVKAVRMIGFADALVSIFSLQTALLYTFSNGTNSWVFNIMTGSAVCILTILIGILIIITANKQLKKLG